jgi:hypothetical protein
MRLPLPSNGLKQGGSAEKQSGVTIFFPSLNTMLVPLTWFDPSMA